MACDIGIRVNIWNVKVKDSIRHDNYHSVKVAGEVTRGAKRWEERTRMERYSLEGRREREERETKTLNLIKIYQ